MRVLGVDPGLTRCGLGVIDSGPGRTLTLVHVEVVGTPTDTPLPQRIERVHAGVSAAIARHRPDAVAVEQVFSQANLRTVMGTAQASGVAILAGTQAGLPVALHTPTEVKAAVTGSGQAGKAQVAAMVRRLLGLAEAPRPADAADALALAICHLWRPRLTALAPLPGATATGPAATGPGGRTPAQEAWARAEAAARSRTRH